MLNEFEVLFLHNEILHFRTPLLLFILHVCSEGN